MMLKIGLTGGIGSGKTFVGNIFRALDIPVYEADSEARKLMTENRTLMDEIRALLGERAYRQDKPDRNYIASVVFKDREKLERLNELVHPVVQKDFMRWSGQFIDKDYVIEEAALIFESGSNSLLDHVIVVTADKEIRIQRVMERDRLDRERVEARIRNQMDDEEKRQMADFEINNDGDAMVLPQVIEIHERLLELNRKKHG